MVNLPFDSRLYNLTGSSAILYRVLVTLKCSPSGDISNVI